MNNEKKLDLILFKDYKGGVKPKFGLQIRIDVVCSGDNMMVQRGSAADKTAQRILKTVR